jgi:tetratricopeptide (TPR) repeat protein
MAILPLLLLFTPPSSAEDLRREALAHYGVARWQTRLGQLPSAAKELERARIADAGLAIAPTRDLIRIYADLGRDAAALRLGATLIEQNAADAGTLRTLARVHAAAHHHSTAAQLLAQAVLMPGLQKQPTRRLTVLRELARECDAAALHADAANAWHAVAQFIDDNFTALKAESYDALELHRDRAVALEKEGLALSDSRQYEAALAALKLAAESFNDPRRANDRHAVVRMHWTLCRVHHFAERLNPALSELLGYLKHQPKSAAPYEKLVLLLNQSQRGAEVEPLLKQIIARSPDLAAPQWVLAAHRLGSDSATAQRQFEKLIPTTTDPDLFRVMVEAHAKHHKPRELLALGDSLFPVKPEGPRRVGAEVSPDQADRQQAYASALKSQKELTLTLLKASMDGRPRSAEHWELLGWLADHANAPADLERALNAALMASPRDPSGTAFERLALHHSRHRQWQKLIDLCDRGQGFDIWRSLLKSDALFELGRSEEAYTEARRNVGFARFTVRRQIARLHGMAGEYDAMLNELDGMLKDYKANDEVRRIRIMRAEAFLGLNRIDDMEDELRGLLQDDPDDVLVLNNLGYYLAEKNCKLNEAEAFVRRAIEIDRHQRAKAGDALAVSGTYLDSLGWVLFRRGKLAEARQQLQAASELPDGRVDAIVWDHLGDVCFRFSDKPAAKVAWTRAAALYADDHRGRLQGRAKEVERKLKLAN